MKKFTEADVYLALSCFDGIGYKTSNKIAVEFGSLAKFWQAKSRAINKSRLPFSLVQRFLLFREKFDLDSYKIRLEKALVKYLAIEDKNYPKSLKEIQSPPLVLYIMGELKPEDEKSLAVIGSRKPSAYGREVTQKLSAEIVDHGFTIVSGLARGVDSIAHRVALGKGGRTIAVLGSGHDYIYPPEHRSLAQEICKNGAVVSEYPPSQSPHPSQFPARNRIISGLSLGVLITEGASKSGTKNTAAFAADQGREVFCVPGPINNPLSIGPAELIKLGAKLTTGIEDILEELQFARDLSGEKKKVLKFASSEEEKIYHSLLSGTKSTDQIIRDLGIPAGQALVLLTGLELRGIIKNIGDGQYMSL